MSGALIRLLTDAFEPAVRQRGQRYFASGFVQLVTRSRTQVTARVHGSRTYDVVIELRGAELALDCTCPFVEREGAPCKHLWAVALAADDLGALLDVASKQPRLLLPGWDDDLDDDLDDAGPYAIQIPSRPVAPPASLDRSASAWRTIASQFEPAGHGRSVELHYFLDPTAVLPDQIVRLRVFRRRLGQKGWGDLAPYPRGYVMPQECADPMDRWALALWQMLPTWGRGDGSLAIPQGLELDFLERLADAGRLHLAQIGPDFEPQVLPDTPPLARDAGEPWRLVVELGGDWMLRGVLERPGEARDLSEARLVHDSGLLVWADAVSRFDTTQGTKWLRALARGARIVVSEAEVPQFVQAFGVAWRGPELRVADGLGFRELREPPRPVLELGAPAHGTLTDVKLWFDYAGTRVRAHAPGRFTCSDARLILHRDPEHEAQAMRLLRELGFRGTDYRPTLRERALPEVIHALIDAGWDVYAEKRLVRRAGGVRISVSSGIDWFGVEGGASFDGADPPAPLPFPALLEAVRRKQRLVRLDDGSVGVLPEAWFERWEPAAHAGSTESGALRIPRVQLGVLSLLAESAEEFTTDAAFEKLRGALASFEGIRPLTPPRGFTGKLRGYQQLGLGWLAFLEEHGFGACLADDMGLGKTIQVLALLARRRGPKGKKGAPRAPALVVVPKSLIENWLREAARFAPRLRVRVHHGPERGAPERSFAGHDLVLTTYGTLRRDIAEIAKLELDSVVLDEAQAIKSSTSETAKAVRLLRAPHRVALSGTPIENHMGELWSLFEFLNPGLFSGNPALRAALGGKSRAKGQDFAPSGAATRELVRRVVRPFILRRTKAEVAPELPSRTEQTVLVELEPAERKEYEALQRFFRQQLAKDRAARGPRREAQALPHVLAALLRLRQASCHLGLLDDARLDAPSAKLSLLLEQLREVVEEGHKALVFSQFTSLLAIVQQHLKRARIPHEYLDGATRDRQARVDRFQSPGGPPVFLMSLKAGGVGLNLTAADYVFLLDPWWNPAAEAQAIDRAHRIGQSRPVVAYRLIAKDTVEERVAELQDKKRELVSAVLGGEGALGAGLTRADLEALLE